MQEARPARSLTLKGVSQNNLRGIDLDLPLGRSIVVTGPSGSGKSSLAFETVYAEGQRRYMQSLSTYARQFLQQFRAPKVDHVSNIPPTIALEQVNPVRNSRATVGTSTEIYDYLRLLFEKVGVEYCAKCQLPMERQGLDTVFDAVARRWAGETLVVGFERPLPRGAQASGETLAALLAGGFSRIILDGSVIRVEEAIEKKLVRGGQAVLAVDRLRVPEKPSAEELGARVGEAVGTAWEMGDNRAVLFLEKDGKVALEATFHRGVHCPGCGATSSARTSAFFSFNSPLGACETCKGFGNTLEVDEDLVVPDPRKSIGAGAIDPFMKPSLRAWQKKLVKFCNEARIDTDLPWMELPDAQRRLVFHGDKRFRGVKGVFELLEKEKYKMRIRVFVSRYVSPSQCRACRGARLNPAALRVLVGGKHIAELSEMSLEQCRAFLETVSLSPREREIVRDLLPQLKRRLDYLIRVGLGYVTLSRLTRTLSGGEYQRVLLGTQLSQGLTDTLYVLDEPSIGLHPKDTHQLMAVLEGLRDLGNTLLLVEHDPELILWGQHIVDMGPGAGSRGGQVMFAGARETFLSSTSQTARAVKNWKAECRDAMLKPRPPLPDEWIEVKGASGNNLRGADVAIPLGRLVSVTGVSGSGKSTLVVDTLYQALAKIFHGRSEKIARFESLSGFEWIRAVELIDQSPIGRSSRSNPVTFIKGYDEIRAAFAKSRDAISKGFGPGHFSFNVRGGRCDTCEGEGRVKVDMVFLEDIFVPCEACDEKRFKPQVLQVRYKGKNIDEVLKLSVDEAHGFFKDVPGLRMKLGVLIEVGLGYLQLGQPGFSLSGGEAQRLKIARVLAEGGGVTRRPKTLFILDEPTTGLHFDEVRNLIAVFRRLIEGGHSVLVIEHNLQVVCASDYVIDLGPDGGSGGGNVVAVGTPHEVAKKKLPHTGRYLHDLLSEK